MSHWVRAKSKITDKEHLQQALDEMGIKHKEGGHVTGYQKEKADILLENGRVGLRQQEDGTYEMVGDFYYADSQKLKKYYGNTEKFIEDLQGQYMKVEVKEKMDNLPGQWVCGTETTDNEGNIIMEFNPSGYTY